MRMSWDILMLAQLKSIMQPLRIRTAEKQPLPSSQEKNKKQFDDKKRVAATHPSNSHDCPVIQYSDDYVCLCIILQKSEGVTAVTTDCAKSFKLFVMIYSAFTYSAHLSCKQSSKSLKASISTARIISS